ncbi:MAG TPA: sigma-70 family RNA polymerase sigma factor [Vicinamibacterales bacterium]|jgi:RNA polymerase sigma-70 factor (ECF subfamily)|nr:sigma-70 family RNA polymerase sigma factor [Vicinamibacterales bacterium]
MSAQDDAADVAKVLGGDASAFEPIVRRWQGPLINLAYRFCRDRGRAEDMAQEAFLRAYRGLRTWRRDAAFSTWLFALASNFYRSEIRRLPPLSLPLDAGRTVADRTLARPAIDDEHRDRTVRRAVLGLPAKYRDVLTLFYFHEMDVARTATSLGVPEGTVKARLSRGRDILRAKLPRLLGREST